jgi:hypothetical protein
MAKWPTFRRVPTGVHAIFDVEGSALTEAPAIRLDDASSPM